MSTPEDKLFQQVSQAMQDGDSVKLSELLAQETPDEEQTVTEESEEEVEDTAPPAETEEQVEEEQELSDEDSEEKEEAEEKKEDPDPIAQLRAEIEALKKTTQSHSSQVGRVSGLQRRLSEYDRQLAALKGTTSGKTSEKVTPKIDEALKDLAETDPVLADTLKKVLTTALNEADSSSVAQETARLQALRDTDYESYRDEQFALLTASVPNAAEVFKSESWKNWKKSQKEHVLNLATSDSAEAVIMALNLYKQDMIAAHPELVKTPAKDKEPDAAAQERARQVEESRKRQQQTTPQVPSGKSPSSKKGPVDEKALFEKFSEDIRKDLTGR